MRSDLRIEIQKMEGELDKLRGEREIGGLWSKSW